MKKTVATIAFIFVFLALVGGVQLNAALYPGDTPAEFQAVTWREDTQQNRAFFMRVNQDMVRQDHNGRAMSGDSGQGYWFFGSRNGLNDASYMAMCVDFLHNIYEVSPNDGYYNMYDHIGQAAERELYYSMNATMQLAVQKGGMRIVNGSPLTSSTLQFNTQPGSASAARYAMTNDPGRRYMFAGQINSWYIVTKNNKIAGYGYPNLRREALVPNGYQDGDTAPYYSRVLNFTNEYRDIDDLIRRYKIAPTAPNVDREFIAVGQTITFVDATLREFDVRPSQATRNDPYIEFVSFDKQTGTFQFRLKQAFSGRRSLTEFIKTFDFSLEGGLASSGWGGNITTHPQLGAITPINMNQAKYLMAGNENHSTKFNLSFVYNPRPSSIQVLKNSETGDRLPGATFGLFDAANANINLPTRALNFSGQPVTDQVTDGNGQITFSNLLPNQTYYVKEVTPPPFYDLNTQAFQVQTGEGNTIIANNGQPITNIRKIGTILIRKERAVEQTALPGAVFGLFPVQNASLSHERARGANGQPVADVTSLGSGEVRFTGLEAGKTYYVQEVTPATGYVRNTGSYAVLVLETDVTEIQVPGNPQGVVRNVEVPSGAVRVRKVNDSNQFLPGAQFTIYTDRAGTNRARDIFGNVVAPVDVTTAAGGVFTKLPLNATYYVRETRTPTNFQPDANGPYEVSLTNADVIVEVNQGNPVVNIPDPGSISLVKRSEAPGTPFMEGVEFTVYDSDGNEVESKRTLGTGYVEFTGLYPGTYTVRETDNLPGFLPNTTVYTATVTSNTVSRITDPSRNAVYNIPTADPTIDKTVETATHPPTGGNSLLDARNEVHTWSVNYSFGPRLCIEWQAAKKTEQFF